MEGAEQPVKICLNVTDSCNQACRYCYQHNKKPNAMPLEIAELAIERFSPEEVCFFGGEPTLQWNDVIVPLVSKYPDRNYSITTNGWLLNNEKIDFLAEHNMAVMLSMDGDRETQDYNRREGSFGKLDSMIPYLLDKVDKVQFRGTIIPDTCYLTYENISYAQSKGFKSCYFTVNIFEKWSEEKWKMLDEQIEIYAYNFVKSFIDKTSIINFTPLTSMITLLVKQELGLLDNQVNIYKCGLGEGYVAINHEGNIYTCQEAASSDAHKHFYLGNLTTGIDPKRQTMLQNEMVNDLPIVNNRDYSCDTCPLSFCCKKNTCQVNNYICNNHCLIQSKNTCSWNLMLYKYACLIISLLENHPDFQEYMLGGIING